VLLWYPIKALQPVDAFHNTIAGLGLEKLLVVELFIRSPEDPERLNGTGLVILNPPFTLADHLQTILPDLTRRLAVDDGATYLLATRLPIQRR